MPIDLSEAARMTTSGLLVAAVALPAGLLARVLRPKGEPLLPRWAPLPVPWSGFEVVVAFPLVLLFVVPPVIIGMLNDAGFYTAVYGADFPDAKAKDIGAERAAEAATLRMLWASLFALPLQLGALLLARRALYPAWRPVPLGSRAGKVWLAVVAWLALTPVVLLTHAAVGAVAQHLDAPPDTHSLAKLGNRPPLDQVLFFIEACVTAPLREEVVFRGILLCWCVGRMKLAGAGVSAVTGARPWFVMAAAVVYAGLSGKPPAVAFAVLLAVGLLVMWKTVRTGARRARAVYATAAFFALVHAGVWPSPVPLFVLGLGLGWLSVRTNGLLVPVAVHGLFNAVSVAFVLRGG